MKSSSVFFMRKITFFSYYIYLRFPMKAFHKNRNLYYELIVCLFFIVLYFCGTETNNN